MKHLKNLLSLFFLLTLTGCLAGVRAQTPQPVPPDCVIFFNMTGDGSGTTASGTFDNRYWQCVTWTLGYSAIGTGSMTALTVQSAPLAAGGVPGTWVTYTGEVTVGVNPNTSNTGAVTQMENGDTVTPFMRVLWTEGSFVGTLQGVLYGWRTGRAVGGSGGGGGGGGCSNPCPVLGTQAPGVTPTANPVQVAGWDGTNIERVLTTCPNTARVNVAATGPTQVIAAPSAPSRIRVCNFNGTVDGGNSLDISFVTGTGTNCGTGTDTIAGPYDNITAVDLFHIGAPLTLPAGEALCLTNSGTTAFTGVVIYAVY